jgi:hypothetical protein
VAELSLDGAEFWLNDESPEIATSAQSLSVAVRFE